MVTSDLIVTRAPGKSKSRGLIRFKEHSWPCLLGKEGITTRKNEGDMKTPAGSYHLLFAYQKKSAIPFLTSRLPLRNIKPDDAWCDAPNDPNYNRPVTLPYSDSHEKLYRDDHLYDLIVVMDYNYSRRTMGRGSAVFFHLTDKSDHTAGCVAVSEKIMRYLFPLLSPKTRMIIRP